MQMYHLDFFLAHCYVKAHKQSFLSQCKLKGNKLTQSYVLEGQQANTFENKINHKISGLIEINTTNNFENPNNDYYY